MQSARLFITATCTIAIAELRQRGSRIIGGPRRTPPPSPDGDVVLPVAVSSTTCISEAFSARIAQQMVVDVLYVTILRQMGSDAVAHLDAMRSVIAKRRL